MDQSFLSMNNPLSQNSGAVMIHVCPNYLFPYEPHVNLPVLSFFPTLTQIVFKVDNTIWDSHTFVHSLRIKRIVQELNMSVLFRKGVTYKSFERLETDDVFRSRYSNLYKFFIIFKKILKLLKCIPEYLNSPMVFEVRK